MSEDKHSSSGRQGDGTARSQGADGQSGERHESSSENAATGSLSENELQRLRERLAIDTGSNDDIDAVSKQFDATRERIKEIEKKARDRHHHPTATSELHCHFCSGSASQVGKLCQSETGVAICFPCVKAAFELFDSEPGPE